MNEKIKAILDRECLTRKKGKCMDKVIACGKTANPDDTHVELKPNCWACRQNDDLSQEIAEIIL